MAIDIQVKNKLENGYVQVEATFPKSGARNYKVPEASADSFCNEFKNNGAQIQKKDTFTDFVIVPISIALSFILMNKTKVHSALKFILCTAFGFGVGYVGGIINSNNYVKKKEEIVKKYNAEEISQEDIFDKTLK